MKEIQAISPPKLSLKEKLKAIFKALSRMPYKWAWLTLMICCAMLFSWWDDVIVWGFGITLNWLIIPIYYTVEYCVMLPLTLLLAKKTYDKLNMKVNLRQVLMQSLKNSLFVKLYQKIRRRRQ